MEIYFQKKTKKILKTKLKDRLITGAELLIETLIKLGVKTVFGYPGGAIMPVHDVIYQYQKEGMIFHYLTRHEQGAVHAAEGYARATGFPGVCFSTSGPGATNLVTGIADAMMDSVPLVCFTGQVATSFIGTDAFQETDVIGITAPITKWNYQITDVKEIPYIVEKAFYLAVSGRPGPVVIDIPKDIQFTKVDDSQIKKFNPKELKSYQPVYNPNYHQIKQAADLINDSEKPLVLVGHGVVISKAEKELKEFIEKTNLPFACTLHGLSVLPKSHPNYVGFLGMHGNYAPNILTNQSDLLIALGMRFDDRVTGNLKKYAPLAKVIHVDIDPAELNKNVKATIPIVADVRRTLQKLTPLVKKKNRSCWLTEFKKNFQIEKEKVIDKQINSQEKEILMAEVVNMISLLTKGQANIVSDVGQHQMIVARYYRFERFNSFFSSGGLGTMGFGVPAAIGVKIARPDEKVIAIVGDGGFQMTIQELGTIAEYQIPIKIVVLNNSYLGMVRQWQELFFEKRYAYTFLKNPDLLKISEAYGIKAKRVDEKKDLKKALTEMINYSGPYLLEIKVKKEDLVFPMVPAGVSLDEILLEVKNNKK